MQWSFKMVGGSWKMRHRSMNGDWALAVQFE